MRSSRAIYSVLGCILAGLFIFSIAIVAVFWSVLESGALSDRQRRLVSEIMTDQIGQNVRFDGVIKARLGWNIKVWVEDVSVQSRGMSTVDVLHVNEVRFELNTWQLLQGRIDWDNLILSGADFLFLKQVGGRTSWKLGESTSENEAGRGKVKDRFLELLRDKNIEVTDSSLMLDFRDSGFVFRFHLEVLEFLQEKDSHLTRMGGTGKLNGQEFSVQGAFPAVSQFNAALQVGGTTSTVSGMPVSGLGGHEFEATLKTEFASVGDFQEALGLKRTSEGQGSLQAQLGGSARDIAVQALEISLDGTYGRQLRIEGSIDNLFRLQGANLAVSVTFPKPVTVLQPAQRLFKISLKQISANISGEPENFEIKNVAVKTNAFNPKFKKIGPIEVGNLFRTDEGEISLSGIRLTAGGPDNPYLTVDGEIGNALELEQVALKAHLNIQATELFPLVNFEDETALGRVTGDLLVSDGSGALSLDQLNLQTSETDLWDTSVSVAVKDLERFGEVKSDVELVLEEPATFLGLLGIQTSVRDPIAFKWSTQKAGEAKLDIKAALDFARTGFETQMTAGFRSHKPTLSGRISGESVHVSDIRSLVALGKSISGLVEDPYANRIAKPLVITREAKPLVIAREAKPLVLGNPKDVFRMDRLLKDAEVHIAIEIGKILGVPAVNTVNAVLKIDEGIARLEPIVVSVVGGTATAAITSNLQNKPSRLTAKGHLRGVGLKTLMTLANSDLDAEGSISGPFSLSLDIKQRSNLLQSISGTARLSLAESRIATSLLNLAGLGVIPWLFSKELQKGYTDISFAIMPVELSRGIVMLNNVVIETPNVRVLAHGQINLLNKTLYIRAIPRPLNRADARSRFPVTLSGSLFSPKVSIERGEDSGR